MIDDVYCDRYEHNCTVGLLQKLMQCRYILTLPPPKNVLRL